MRNYTYWQIKHILAEQDFYLRKLARYKEHIPKYQIIDATGKVLAEPVTLDGIRIIFTQLDYPLE